MQQSTTKQSIIKISHQGNYATDDVLAVEEPLQISLLIGTGENKVSKNISVTMRTPGQDDLLAIGFLFTEGIINSKKDIVHAKQLDVTDNSIQIELAENKLPLLQNLERNFYTTSSCGVCGKTSIDAIRTNCNQYPIANFENKLPIDYFFELPDLLRKQQNVFDNTGSIHAAALFTHSKDLVFLCEDVGRHNALDKLIGKALIEGMLPLSNYTLLLSGRASFELVQKAAMAGIAMIASVGAPSSLAVQLADEFNITLIGFLRDKRFNIYTHPQRILQ